MRYSKVGVNSFNYFLPRDILTSATIEERLSPLYERLRLPTGRLELMTGIKERRVWPEGTRPSEVSARAGELALQSAGVDKQEIDCLLHCSVCRDFVEPATSTAAHRLLGLSGRALNFDISNACLGVLSGMTQLANMIELGQVRCGMVVAGENSRPLMESTIAELNSNVTLTRRDIKPWFASLTIGSAAAAVVMSHVDFRPAPMRFLGGAHFCDTRYNHLCQGGQDGGMVGGGGVLMRTDSEELLKRGVAVAKDTWELTKQDLAWDNGTPDVICTHQVGKRHSDYLYDSLGLDVSKDFATVETLGNCGSVSLPVTAAMAIEAGRLPAGGKLALLGIGSGINCLMIGVEKV
ncbi:MAG: 3-oxoacyl-ACP synthase III [Lentisphaeria bacterium]|nr:3-oxoacyl-ACP synthase III [Lentisphaeria bacterium]